MTRKILSMFAFLAVSTGLCIAQETTGSIQGVIKDPSGAVVSHAKVTVTAPNLVGEKTTETDSKGYYHFTNLPPGTYVETVEAPGFSTLKREGLVLEVGHSPSVDLKLSVGSENAVVEVTTESPQIDVTTVTTQTNVTQDVIDNVPHGSTFQSVIQFAPAASNEPLMGGYTAGSATGGGFASGQSDGLSYGYSIAGGADTENSYLVEGQDTANLIGGFSHTNVPFDFISEVQVKSSGIAAEHGGALGGVINVVMQKGTTHYHGSVSAQLQSQMFNANSSAYLRYNPDLTPTDLGTAVIDQPIQAYYPKKPHYSYLQPGFTVGGPLIPFGRLRDKLFFFVGFEPELDRYELTVTYPSTTTYGTVPFSQNTNTYYTTARIDAQATKKIRVFGSYLYQLQKQYGESIPGPDSIDGARNTYASNPPSQYLHTQGYTAPNITLNTGADITVTNNIVLTSRFGYYFENYHDFGYTNAGNAYFYETSGVPPATDYTGKTSLPAGLQYPQYSSQGPGVITETFYNSNKAIQLDQDAAIYKSGWLGTHNFKVGYQLRRLSNLLAQAPNVPVVDMYAGDNAYSTQTTAGPPNCAAIAAADGTPLTTTGTVSTCQGKYGYLIVNDDGTGGSAISYNHSIFGQDTWTIARGITLNLGVRVEKEYLPGELSGAGVPPNPISFGWGDKVAPRIGAAWDVFQNGKMKVFGDYGVFNDQMKLNLAISSFGGEYGQSCAYALDATSEATLNFVYNSTKRVCAGGSGSPANFTGSGAEFIENVNIRAAIVTCATCNPYEEAVAPNLKPYRQHESTGGVDYQLSKLVSFEARYDRRRLDNVIEDSSIYNPAIGETFVIVNPGEGVNGTFNGFCNFLYSTGPNPCTSSSGLYPPSQTIPAARSYDGVEFRFNKAMANHWYGMVSYTYSHFRGNYTGLTSTDQADGGGGRISPNNNRSFDEPYFSWNGSGGSSSGLLPTDRPNKLKGYGYYEFKYLKHFTTDVGLFGYIYQGTPNTSFLQDVGLFAAYDFPVDVFNRGKWADVSQDPNTGAVTVGKVRTYRTPPFSQADLNVNESYKLPKGMSVLLSMTATNVLNEHAVTAVNEQIDSPSSYISQAQFYSLPGAIAPGGPLVPLNVTNGVPWYATAQNKYDIVGLLQGNPGSIDSTATFNSPQTINAAYGKPNRYQNSRSIRLAAHFTF